MISLKRCLGNAESQARCLCYLVGQASSLTFWEIGGREWMNHKQDDVLLGSVMGVNLEWRW